MSAQGRFHDVADRLSSCRTEAAVLKQFERISVVGKFVAYLMYRDLQAVYSVILKLASRSCTPPAAVKTFCNIHSLHTALLWSADPLNLSRIKPGRSVLHETDCRQNIACEGLNNSIDCEHLSIINTVDRVLHINAFCFSIRSKPALRPEGVAACFATGPCYR